MVFFHIYYILKLSNVKMLRNLEKWFLIAQIYIILYNKEKNKN